MTTSDGCGRDPTAADLVRHERERTVVVHCPECKRSLGRYDRRGDDPQTDRRREWRGTRGRPRASGIPSRE